MRAKDAYGMANRVDQSDLSSHCLPRPVCLNTVILVAPCLQDF